MGRVEDFADQLDAAWSHRWESVVGALEGVTDDEAAWQAPCYRAEEREEDFPAPGTILWQVAHIAHCKRYYARVLRARNGNEMPSVEPRVACRGLGEEVAAMENAHRAQVAGIRALADADLDGRTPNGMTIPEFLAHQVRHDVWHASQIAVARRLYRTRA